MKEMNIGGTGSTQLKQERHVKLCLEINVERDNVGLIFSKEFMEVRPGIN
jgi:hypothetical protein